MEIRFENWQKGCPTCPEPIKFNSQSQYVAHLAGKKHAKALKKVDALQRLQRLDEDSRK